MSFFHFTQRKLVFESCLLPLFSTCPVCNNPTKPTTYTIGTFLRVTQCCDGCNYQRQWDSQPMIKNTPAGNLLLSAAILFTGALPTKTIRVLEVLNCATISLPTYHIHQRRYLQPTVLNAWHKQQSDMISLLQAYGEPLSLGGDGRNDSPGHCAKYGSYTFMDLEHILDVELVQVCG